MEWLSVEWSVGESVWVSVGVSEWVLVAPSELPFMEWLVKFLFQRLTYLFVHNLILIKLILTNYIDYTLPSPPHHRHLQHTQLHTCTYGRQVTLFNDFLSFYVLVVSSGHWVASQEISPFKICARRKQNLLWHPVVI